MASNEAFVETGPHAGRTAPNATLRRGYVVSFGMAATLQAAVVFAQAVSAGSGLAGSPGMFSLHGSGATVVHLVAIIQVIVAVLLWRPGRGPWWPAAVSVILLFAGFAQSALGGSGSVAVHVPLGLALFAGAVWLAVWAWMPRTAAAGDRR